MLTLSLRSRRTRIRCENALLCVSRCLCVFVVAFAVLRVYDLLCTNSRRTSYTNTHAHDSNRVSVEKGRSPQNPQTIKCDYATSSVQRTSSLRVWHHRNRSSTVYRPKHNRHRRGGSVRACVLACVRPYPCCPCPFCVYIQTYVYVSTSQYKLTAAKQQSFRNI